MKTLSIFLTIILSSTSAFASSDLQLARVNAESLTCEVSVTTTPEGTDELFAATLEVRGYSNAPAVWDPVKQAWRNIKNEPLFVFAQSDGDNSVSKDYRIQLTHKRYVTPTMTNIEVGQSTIGTLRDMPFKTRIDLKYFLLSEAEETKSIKRSVYVNHDKACDVHFDVTLKKWTITSQMSPP